jgi:predicted nuclease with RNAse H fold
LSWYGADPGGKSQFGVAALDNNGLFKTWLCSSVDEALAKIAEPTGIGIDSPLWWSSGEGGGRFADSWLRRTYRIAPGTVQSVNSLKGAAVVQGVTLALRLRRSDPSIPITESHPKALIVALKLPNWEAICGRFGLHGSEPKTEHERDAVLSAVAAREGSLGHWKLDLSEHVGPSEFDPKATWFGAVNYWWPTDSLGESVTQANRNRRTFVRNDFQSATSSSTSFNRCPECSHEFRGKGWGGIDAHWKAKHEDICPYEVAWPLIVAGQYKSTRRNSL